jgi:hypothetical protein
VLVGFGERKARKEVRKRRSWGGVLMAEHDGGWLKQWQVTVKASIRERFVTSIALK